MVFPKYLYLVLFCTYYIRHLWLIFFEYTTCHSTCMLMTRTIQNLIASIEHCLDNINSWMTTNMLKLNKDKTEFLIVTSKKTLQRTRPTIHFGSDEIQPSDHVKNIGVTLDSTMSMIPHTNSVCKSSFYLQSNISRIRKYLSVKTKETLIHAFISSKIDHCNSLLFGLPIHLIQWNLFNEICHSQFGWMIISKAILVFI